MLVLVLQPRFVWPQVQDNANQKRGPLLSPISNFHLCAETTTCDSCSHWIQRVCVLNNELPWCVYFAAFKHRHRFHVLGMMHQMSFSVVTQPFCATNSIARPRIMQRCIALPVLHFAGVTRNARCLNEVPSWAKKRKPKKRKLKNRLKNSKSLREALLDLLFESLYMR